MTTVLIDRITDVGLLQQTGMSMIVEIRVKVLTSIILIQKQSVTRATLESMVATRRVAKVKHEPPQAVANGQALLCW
jgi:hypothetical protein